MKMDSLIIDVAFTTHQSAAIKSLWLALEEMDRMWIPVYKSELLNGSGVQIPDEEGLEQIISFWEEEIYPSLGLYDIILIVAHSSILKVLLDEIKGHKDLGFVFPYGEPYLIRLNEDFEVKSACFIGS